MRALTRGAYSDGLYDEGTEDGENVDDMVFKEFDLHHSVESLRLHKKSMEASSDMWRRRRRREVTPNSTMTYIDRGLLRIH